MKKLRIILVLLFFFAITCLVDSNVFALTSNDLISVGTGRYAITVTKQTTIQQIKDVLGEPRVETPSAFGGRAYTFYTDDNYSNYLYIETTSNGIIASYGSVYPTYKTYTYSYDDAYNYRENGVLHGCLFNFGGKIKGGIYYNKYEIFDGNYNDTVNFYEETYKSDENTYLRSLIEHSVPMFNALSTNQGYKTNLKFDEEDIEFLRSKKIFSEKFLNYLKDFKFSGDIWAIPEGTVVFPGEPLVTIKAPMIEAQLLETVLLLMINHQSLIATKTNRIVKEAGGRVTDLYGNAQRYDTGIKGAIISNGVSHEQILEIVKKYTVKENDDEKRFTYHS